MADNVDDTRNFIEKSNSSSSLSLNPADSVQINSNQQLDDAEYINNTIDVSTLCNFKLSSFVLF